MSDKIYWTFEFDGDRFDLEMESEAKLYEYVDEWWAERCQENAEYPLKNGQTIEDEGHVIQFCYDDDGDFTELHRAPYPLHYEHYHGDFKEHNTYY